MNWSYFSNVFIIDHIRSEYLHWAFYSAMDLFMAMVKSISIVQPIRSYWGYSTASQLYAYPICEIDIRAIGDKVSHEISSLVILFRIADTLIEQHWVHGVLYWLWRVLQSKQIKWDQIGFCQNSVKLIPHLKQHYSIVCDSLWTRRLHVRQALDASAFQYGVNITKRQFKDVNTRECSLVEWFLLGNSGWTLQLSVVSNATR